MGRGIGLLLVALLAVAALLIGVAGDDPPPDPALAGRCAEILALGERAGIVIAADVPGELLVDRERWAGMDWQAKQGLAGALTCVERGGAPGLTSVRVIDAQSGRVLASGVPGTSGFRPE